MNNTPVPDTFPSKLMSKRTEPWTSIALNGWAWSSLATSQVSRSKSLLGCYERSVVVMTGGTQDLQEGDTAETVLSDMEAYALASRNLGADSVVATTITPSVNFDATEESRRLALNASILFSTAFDAVVDLAALPELDDHTDVLYYSDGTHLTSAGAQVAADAVGLVLYPILDSL